MNTWREYAALAKPRLLPHVGLSAAAGAWIADPSALGAAEMTALVAGTVMTAAGTMALNQWLERDVDARMERTRSRPVASGRLEASRALGFALVVSAVGLATLLTALRPLTALLAAATLLLYAFVYTPLKRVTSAGAAIGYVPGALPVLGGWAATGRSPEEGGLQLFLLVVLWQLPHVAALGWLLRDDYRRGGLVMPGHDDANGTKSSLFALATSCLLVPAGFALAPDATMTQRLVVAALGVALLVAPAWAWRREGTRSRAHGLFRATLAYLPLSLLALAA